MIIVNMYMFLTTIGINNSDLYILNNDLCLAMMIATMIVVHLGTT